jgi:chromosome segregation ATPase
MATVSEQEVLSSAESQVRQESLGSSLTASVEEDREQSILAAGILNVLGPAVKQIDDKVDQVKDSQTKLKEQIDKLAEELCQLAEKQKIPIDLDTYIKKLAISRRRILLVNDILQNVHERMDKLQRNINKETIRQRSAIEACQ